MNDFVRKRVANAKHDILSGLTVALALVPEAVAFAFVAGVDPLVGLYAAFMIGLITSVLGGRPGMISGATGALAVVMVSLVAKGNAMGADYENLGLYYLFATVILMGGIQILAGVFRLGKLVRLIPHPVMMGFVNGLAIVIFLSQLGMFQKGYRDLFGNPVYEIVSKEKKLEVRQDNKVYDLLTEQYLFDFKNNRLESRASRKDQYIVHQGLAYDLDSKKVVFKYNDTEKAFYTVATGTKSKHWLPLPKLLLMLGLVGLTMGIMWVLPKLKFTSKLPGALFAILLVSAVAILGKLDVATVGSFIAEGGGSGLKGSLPSFQWKIFEKIPLNWETFRFITPYALILAAIGLIESLMTLNLIDELTETRGNSNRECVAQGTANIVTALFGGMGGCAMIGQSIINIKSGGRTRLSGIVASLTLLAFILFGSQYIEQIPIAALVGVMFMVVIGTFAWSSFRIIHKIPVSDALVLILVSSLTVFFDLAIAVLAGVVLSSLVFAWENAKRIRARKHTKDNGTKVYEIWGPLFFGSIQAFHSKFDLHKDPKVVEIDFMESRVSDHSALEAIFTLVGKYQTAGKQVHLKHLSEECQQLMIKASPKLESVITKSIDDPRYHVMAKVMKT